MEDQKEKLAFAKAILFNGKDCSTCWFGRAGNEEQRHCGLYSVSCATALGHRLSPTSWMSYEEGEAINKRQWKK